MFKLERIVVLVTSDTFFPPLQPDHTVMTELFVARAHDAPRLILHYPAGAVHLLPLLLPLGPGSLIVAPVVFWPPA